MGSFYSQRDSFLLFPSKGIVSFFQAILSDKTAFIFGIPQLFFGQALPFNYLDPDQDPMYEETGVFEGWIRIPFFQSLDSDAQPPAKWTMEHIFPSSVPWPPPPPEDLLPLDANLAN